jgi:hypothetical protein
VQSGSSLRAHAAATARTRNAELLLKQLGIPKERIPDLQKLAWQEILEAQVAIGGAAPGTGFAPVIDGKYLPHDPFDPVAAAGVRGDSADRLDDAGSMRPLGLTNFDLDDRRPEENAGALRRQGRSRVRAVSQALSAEVGVPWCRR